MHATTLDPTPIAEVPTTTLPPAAVARRDEQGVTTMEYAVCCGAGVGIGGILWKLLTSSFGQEMVRSIFTSVKGLLPF